MSLIDVITKYEDQGIATVHPELRSRLPQIQRCIDAIEGSDIIKAKGEEYLPILGSQDSGEYDAYKLRANFLGATERTSIVMVGALMRKPPKINIPDKLKYLIEDTTGFNEGIEDFVRKIAGGLLATGRTAILLDRTVGNSNRLYMSHYDSYAVTDWDIEEHPGQPPKLVRVVLEEDYLERDGYIKYSKTRFREYFLQNGQAHVSFWEEAQTTRSKSNFNIARGQKQFEKQKTVKLTQRGKPMDYLPISFVSYGPTNSYKVAKPPLLAIADINLSHYRTSADLEHGRHWTALPTPWFSGIREEDPIYLGSGKAMILPDPAARAGFLEFTGTGLKALSEARKEKEEQMAYLGARMLSGNSAGSENAEVARMNHSGEVAVLTDLARGISKGLEDALKKAAMWEGLPTKDISVKINTDYINTTMSPAELQSLTVAYQSGAISIDSYLRRLQQGEILGEEIDIEDEKERLELANTDNLMEDLLVSDLDFGSDSSGNSENSSTTDPKKQIDKAKDTASDIKEKVKKDSEVPELDKRLR